MGGVRLVIADDEHLLRSGLRLVLHGARGIDVVGEAGDGSEAVDLALTLRPDLVLMDIRMPGGGGIEATRRLTRHGVRVLVLTAFETDTFLLDAMQAGAVGFLLKTAAPGDLVRSVLAAAEGEPTFSPSVIGRLVALAGQGRPRPDARIGALTDRELDVAIALGRGLTNTEIAQDLSITLATVKTHLLRVFTKLEVANRVQVALVLHEAGMLSEDPSPGSIIPRS